MNAIYPTPTVDCAPAFVAKNQDEKRFFARIGPLLRVVAIGGMLLIAGAYIAVLCISYPGHI